MAKKIGKLLALSAVIGAAAGVIYYYRSKDNSLEDFDDDVNDDLEEFLKDETGNDSKREYVPLNFSKETVEEAKETIQKAGKTVEGAVSDIVNNTVNEEDSAPKTEDFQFNECDDSADK